MGQLSALANSVRSHPDIGAARVRPITLTAASAERANEHITPIESSLDRALMWSRWAVLLVVLVIATFNSLDGRGGIPTWGIILIFCVYNAIIELLRRNVVWLSSFARTGWLDLAVVAALYAVGATPDGPLFVLFVLITACCATSMRWRIALVYCGIAVLTMGGIAFTLPRWVGSVGNMRTLGAQSIILAIVGVGTSLLVDQVRRHDAAARQAQAEAARHGALDHARSVFVSAISHELRTPLTAARAGLGLAVDSATDRLNADELSLLRAAQRNVEWLQLLIDDLLTYNEIEAGTLQIERAHVCLKQVVDAALIAVGPMLRQRRQTASAQVSSALECCGDRRRLEQLLVNLLANACVHTPTGTRISISSSTVGWAATGVPAAVLSIADTGPGIPPGEEERIFQRFVRADTQAPGSGLGLPIARAIAELHGGCLWAENAPVGGALFHVELPLSCPDDFDDLDDLDDHSRPLSENAR